MSNLANEIQYSGPEADPSENFRPPRELLSKHFTEYSFRVKLPKSGISGDLSFTIYPALSGCHTCYVTNIRFVNTTKAHKGACAGTYSPTPRVRRYLTEELIDILFLAWGDSSHTKYDIKRYTASGSLSTTYSFCLPLVPTSYNHKIFSDNFTALYRAPWFDKYSGAVYVCTAEIIEALDYYCKQDPQKYGDLFVTPFTNNAQHGDSLRHNNRTAVWLTPKTCRKIDKAEKFYQKATETDPKIREQAEKEYEAEKQQEEAKASEEARKKRVERFSSSKVLDL